ncbi:hypothetical protein [Sulfuricaulis sp.]|uniref:hypothetical protein n=1 Tax=Sulfuricaulis sp. TaxID=2003553 RepID=UPI0025D389C0|nr:hypothetical protein [Sulfuricaulis sp.]
MTKANTAISLDDLLEQKVERPKHGPAGNRTSSPVIQIGSLSFVPREDSHFLSDDTTAASEEKSATTNEKQVSTSDKA